MRKILMVLIVALFITSCASSREIYFRGELVQDTRDGLTIVADEKKRIIAVTSYVYHYSIVLPYSEDWKFSRDEYSTLLGNSGRINVSLILRRNQGTPKEYLYQMKKRLSAKREQLGIEKIEILRFRNDLILRNVVDANKATGSDVFPGVKHLNLYTVRAWKDTLYILHLSKVLSPGESKKLNEKKFREYVTVGFAVDFMRE